MTFTASVPLIPGARLPIVRSLPAEPTEIEFAVDATEFAPSATELAAAAYAPVPTAVLLAADAALPLPADVAFEPLATGAEYVVGLPEMKVGAEPDPEPDPEPVPGFATGGAAAAACAAIAWFSETTALSN